MQRVILGLLPAAARRSASLAAVTALAALAVGFGAVPAQAGQAGRAGGAVPGQLSVTISGMNPQVAGPGSTVTVHGTVSNGTGQAQSGLEVQLSSSAAPFVSRDQMNSYVSGSGYTSLTAVGSPYLLPAVVPPGGTAGWTASFPVSAAGLTAFGVYPVTAQLVDVAVGAVLTSEQTLLPYWPGRRASGLTSRLKISWAWPLIDQPHHQACAALTNDGLAASLAPGGRLSALLTAGAAHPGADLTWVLDPALLADAATMTGRYRVGGTPDCTGGTEEDASTAAVRWLSAVRAVAASEPVVLTPYADVDVSALVHQGLSADLKRAYALGEEVAASVLGRRLTPTIAIPPGGTADLSVLTSLAATEGIGTVVLASSEMPPEQAQVFEPDNAVTSVRTPAGTTMNVLLADDELTRLLARADAGSGALPAGAAFAVRQQFLAETAMIADEAPDSDRSVVVQPPDDWSPSGTLAGDLLSETTTAPWLQPDRLGSLASDRAIEHATPRQPPPASQASPGELSRGYLAVVRAAGARLGRYESMLYQVKPSYRQSLQEALAAAESAAWRGPRAAQGLALARNLDSYLADAEGKIRIITPPQVEMSGISGAVPVSIENGLLGQAIRVRLSIAVPAAPGQSARLTIGRFQDLVVVQPQQAVTLRLPVSSAPIGSTIIRFSLTSADGRPLPVSHASLTVQSTRYGRAILILIAAAIGVLVLTSLYRGLRRRLRGEPPPSGEDAGSPGSVGAGSSGRNDPTEAPDELADARRWADGS